MADPKARRLPALARLDGALRAGFQPALIREAHDALLSECRNERGPAQPWDEYPVGRDYFLQEHR